MPNNMNMVTGYQGTGHVTAADDGSFNAAVFGEGNLILGRGEKLRAEIINSNTVRIYDGDIVMQGRHARINTSNYVELTINNGTVGTKRNDLVCVRYEKDTETLVETANLVVIKGTETSGTPTDPSYNEGSIFEGATIVDAPIYRIQLDGISVGDPVRICDIAANASELMPVGGNGYCKLPDGTLICYGRVNNVGSGYGVVAFAQSFVDTNYAFTATAGYLYGVSLTLNAVTQKLSASAGNIYFMNADGTVPTSTTVYAEYVAVGRWK